MQRIAGSRFISREVLRLGPFPSSWSLLRPAGWEGHHGGDGCSTSYCTPQQQCLQISMRLISKKAALRQRRSIVRTGCAMASDAALAGHAQPVDVPPPGQQQQRRLPPLVLYGQVKTRGRDEGMDGMYLHYWYTAPPPWLAVRSCPPPSHSPSLPTFLPSPSIPSSLSPSLPPSLPSSCRS